MLALSVNGDEDLLKHIFELTCKEEQSGDFLYNSPEFMMLFLEKVIDTTNWISLRLFIENSRFDIMENNRLLHYSIANWNSNPSCFDYLINHPKGINPNRFYYESNAFLTCVSNPNISPRENLSESLIKMLTAKFPIDDVNAVDTKENSILMYAVAFANMKLIQSFISIGADCNKRNNEGTTLHFPAKNVKLIIDYGVETQVVNDKGFKAIEHAARYANQNSFETLLSYESDKELNRKNGHQKKTLHISAVATKSRNLELLLKRKIDVETVDADGNLFIHKMMKENKTYSMSILEKMQSNKIAIDVKAINNNGRRRAKISVVELRR